MGGGARISPHTMQLRHSCSIAYRSILCAKDVIYRGGGKEGDGGGGGGGGGGGEQVNMIV